ncbi:hypothetical protein [Photobacterium damselae]|uniref:hypothetical protein n=1 Tax=Photobacterium damselae TaxID=38293 RepID=UPI004068AA90
MSSNYLERMFFDLPPRYMGQFDASVNKSIQEWDYVYGKEKPRFITMVFSTVFEEMLLLNHNNQHISHPILKEGFSELVEKHSLFKYSPYSPMVNYAALIALQSAWLLDEREFSLYIEFWETLMMDVIDSVVYVSTMNRGGK